MRIVNRFVCSSLSVAMFLYCSTAYCDVRLVDKSLWPVYGYDGGEEVTSVGAIGDFIIDGALYRNDNGSHGDEGAITAVIAEQVSAHGAFLCPYQLQCSNCKRCRESWMELFYPNGGGKDRCAWFCERGYSGVGCEKQYDVGDDTSGDVVANLYSGISQYTHGKDNWPLRNANVAAFHGWNYVWNSDYNNTGAHYVFLGVTKFLTNGVIVAPVLVGCNWDGWPGNDSWVERAVLRSDNKKLLCKEGYTPNETNTDCVFATEEKIEEISPTFCPNFPEAGYNSTIHSLKERSDRGCYIYVCKDEDKAFAAAGNTAECVDCAPDIRGGPHPDNGTCVRCNQVGQYFDVESGDCKSAFGLSQNDLLYGRGNKKSETEDKKPCWAEANPNEYKKCVMGDTDDNAIKTTGVIGNVLKGKKEYYRQDKGS